MKKSEKINKDYLVFGGLVAITLTSGAILSSLHVSADDTTVDDISITVPVSCSLSSTGNDSHTATIPNGIYSGTYSDTTSGVDYTNGIGTTTIKAYCNDNNGFAIYAAGYTGEVVGEENSNKLVGTTSGIGNIDTNLNTSGNTSGWSMKLTVTGDSGDTTNSPLTIDSAPNVSLPSEAESGATSAPFSSYHVVPNEYTKVAHKNSSTDMAQTTGGATLTTTYAAYISPTQPAGTYEGKVIYVMVHPADAGAPVDPLKPTDCQENSICYAPNASDIEGSMSSLGTVSASGTAGRADATANSTADLIAPNFKREGYGFAGWSTEFNITDINNTAATIYGPNETISTNPNEEGGVDISQHGLILYPVWVAAETGVTMQSFNATNYANYNSAAIGTVIALKDERDNDVYAVAKLADGNWWMIENLRLDNEATINTTNTNKPISTFVALSASNSGTWCTTNDAACDDQSMLNTNNTNIGGTGLTVSHIANNNSSQWYSYGNYYNWYSATAGNGTYSKDSGNVSGDLCPTNWQLPIGGSTTTTNKSFAYLDTRLGGTGANQSTTEASNRWRKYPNSFVYSGYWYESSARSRGSSGGYWSSSAGGSNGAYRLFFGSSNVFPGTNSNNKYLGSSVRCVAGS